MTSFSQRVIFYIDDFEPNIEAFRTTCDIRWQSDFSVHSNKTFGRIDKSNFDEFVEETLSEMNKIADTLECIMLDLDYSGETPAVDKTCDLRVGLQLGHRIRKNWPLVPIFISSRFSDQYVKSKGLLYDFDHIDKPESYLKIDQNSFEGILSQAKSKRNEIVHNLPDTPTSYLIDKHSYFNRVEPIKNIKNEVFVAMPFDTNLVSDDIREMIFQAVKDCNLLPFRVDKDIFNESIMEKIAAHILESNYLIADITTMNPNVMFELGMAMASNKKCIIIMNNDSSPEIPFDLRSIPIIYYENNKLTALKNKLKERIEYCQN